ncbi:MAG TPA: hypothetical protein VGK58_02385, partial [Lacipirellulaceae bacterium]
MADHTANKSIAQRAGLFAIVLAALTTAARLIDLARTSAEDPPPHRGGIRGSVDRASTSEPLTNDAEFAQLYEYCPMAAVVDLQMVAVSPEQVDALLPRYRAIAQRVRAAEPSPSPSLRGMGRRDWLVDPNEWYTPGERERRKSLEANASPHSRPIGKEWKLLTPEDMADQAAKQIAPEQILAPPSESEPQPAPPSEAVNEQPTAARPVPAADSQPASPPFDALDVDSAPPRSPTQPDIALPTTESAQSIGDPTGEPLFEAPSAHQTPPTLPIAPRALPAYEALPPPPQKETLPSPEAVNGASDTDALFEPPSAHQTPATIEIAPPPSDIAVPSNAEHPAPGIQHPAPNVQHPATLFPAPATSDGDDPHIELFAKNAYPSARECATCHEDIYHEWSVSAHA